MKRNERFLLHRCAPCSGTICRYIETPLGNGEAYLSCLFGFSFPVSLSSLALLRHLGLTSPFVQDSSVDFSRTPLASWHAACLPAVAFLQSHSAHSRGSPPRARRIPVPAAAPTPHRWTIAHKCVHTCKSIGGHEHTHTHILTQTTINSCSCITLL